MMIGKLWITREMAPEIANDLSVTKRTVEGWYAKGIIPPTAYALLDILRNGNLGRLHEAWDGWKIDTRSGDLVTPILGHGRNRTVTSRHIFMQQIMYQQLSALKIANRELREQNARLEKRTAELEAQIEAYNTGQIVPLQTRKGKQGQA